MKVDAKKKLVTKYETTGVNVHDSRMFDKLVDESDEVGKRSKESSEMVDRRGNETQSDQMKANGR